MKLNIKSADEDKPEKAVLAKVSGSAKKEKPASKPITKPAKKSAPVKAENPIKKPEPKKESRATSDVAQTESRIEPKKERKDGEYSAKDIYVLKGLEPVRQRPGMYIGSTGIDGLHHLIHECLDNAIDESMAGYAKNIEVVLLPDNRVKVSDDGRGIPVEKHADTKKSALETVMTTLHAGGKFGGEAYKVSGGLHGVGISVVCALSTYMLSEVHRDGGIYQQEYFRGQPKTAVKRVGDSKKTGTIQTFEADPQIFKEIKYDPKRILSHIRQQAYLTKGVKIIFKDEREKGKESSYSFYFEGGVASYVRYLVEGNTPRHPNIFSVATTKEDIFVEAAFQYTQEMECTEESFANNIYTPEGGMHISGFRTALTRSLNDYARREGFLKEKDENFSGDDVREGMTAVISVKIRTPQFEGQTKAKLGNPEAKNAVEAAISDGLSDYLERNPSDAKSIIENCLLAIKARLAAKAARQTVLRKGALDGLALPGKLADCLSRKAEESELYIVEGDSAGGCFFGETKVSLFDGRDISFKQLVEEDRAGKKNYCYTIKNDGAVGVELIKNPRITKQNAEVIKVILDNGEEIICTSDHKFMLRDESYKMAKDLKTDDSLMPLHKKLSKIEGRITIKGYEMVLNPANSKRIFTHKTYVDKFLKTMKAICERYGKIDKEKYQNERIKTNDKSLLKYETIRDRFFAGNDKKLAEAISNYNHKIKRIEKVNEKIDVYDIEVPSSHNFALASGIFVHNSSKQARDRRFQAILPLRGKILNVERARLDKMLASKEIKALIIAMGTGIGEDFNIEKLRYHKIVIMTDADVDGAHIRTLLLTFFYRHFKPIVDAGNIYIAQPPLYKIQSGKSAQYAYTDEQKEKIIKDIGKTTVSIQRYKGLGEMNPEQLWETTMNPENRTLLQVAVAEAREADKTLDILMGEQVEPRKKFIQTHAKAAKNIDI